MLKNRKIHSFILTASFVLTAVCSPIGRSSAAKICDSEKATYAFSEDVSYAKKADDNGSDRIIVSLGDSYSAGEGIEPFYGQLKKDLTESGDYFGKFEGMFDDSENNAVKKKIKEDDWLAHRSQYAWSGMLTLPGVEGNMAEHRDENWYFVASSGAETKHLNDTKQEKKYNIDGIKDKKNLDEQFKIFDSVKNKKIDYVTMTMGGNDVGFSNIVTSMVVTNSYFAPNLTNALLLNAYNQISPGGSTYKNLKKAYKAIEDKAGKDAAIIIAGYPVLFDPSDLLSKCIIDPIEAKKVTKAVYDFNNVIESIVNECHESGMNIHFVDVMAAFKDHGAYSKDPYINEVMFSQAEDINKSWYKVASSYSVHPNLKGAVAYAECVQKKIDELEEKEGRLGDKINPDYKKAYLDILQQNQKEINNYNWQDQKKGTSKQVALYDICGDGTPELFFITAPKPDTAATLHIYTYDKGSAKEIYSCDIDSTAGSGNLGYVLFSTGFTRNIFLFSGYSDSFSEASYKKLSFDGDKLVEKPFISVETPEDDSESKKYSYRGSSISKKKYDKIENNLLYCAKDILICDDDYKNHMDKSKKLKSLENCSMDYKEAVLLLNDGKTAGNDVIDAIDDTIDMVFYSGAGAWSTGLTIEKDGSFYGNYHDSNSGEVSDEYPHGTVGICNFSGQFTDIQKIDDYTYTMRMSAIVLEYEVGSEWTESGFHYIAQEPYGLETDNETVYTLYCPGASTADMSDECKRWYAMPQSMKVEDIPGKLPCYGLYNPKSKTAFFGGKKLDKLNISDLAQFRGFEIKDIVELLSYPEDCVSEENGFAEFDYQGIHAEGYTRSGKHIVAQIGFDGYQDYSCYGVYRGMVKEEIEATLKNYGLNRLDYCQSDYHGAYWYHAYMSNGDVVTISLHEAYGYVTGALIYFRDTELSEYDLTPEQCMVAMKNYYYGGEDKWEEPDTEHSEYWAISSVYGDTCEIVHRCPTGAEYKYYINMMSGEGAVTMNVPGVTDGEVPAGEGDNHFYTWYYLEEN